MCVINFRVISCTPFFLASFSHLTYFLRLADISQIVCSRLKTKQETEVRITW